LERGDGVEPDVERQVSHDRRAALPDDLKVLFDLGRCLENGKGIDRDLDRATNVYRTSAERKKAAAQNGFAICVELTKICKKTTATPPRFERNR
jgi:TPR repeat protein